MQNRNINPPLMPFVRYFFGVVALVVIFGAGLFVWPDLIRPRWPWTIAPFNAAFLGGVYLTELGIDSVLIWVNRANPGRLVLPMSLVFTGVVSIVTLFYLSQFNYEKVSTYAWFVAYFGSMFVTAFLVWHYRSIITNIPKPPTNFLRFYLLVEGIGLFLYGLGLLALPAQFSGWWPWKIDNFHSQVYSAVFLSGGVGLIILYLGFSKVELLGMGLTQLSLGLFSTVGLLIVDASQHRVNWSGAGTWVWLAINALLFGTGGWLLWLAQVKRSVVNSTPDMAFNTEARR